VIPGILGIPGIPVILGIPGYDVPEIPGIPGILGYWDTGIHHTSNRGSKKKGSVNFPY
jgi:hypothetical protein